MAFRLSRTYVPVALISCAALATSSCGDDEPSVELDVTSDVATDSTPDTAFDGGTDVGADASSDTQPDATPDADADADALLDSEPDATLDTAPDTTPDATPEPITVAGNYDDGFGGFVRIGATFISYSWYGEDITITDYDNEDGWIVGQNSDEDPWAPGLWSRIDWVSTDEGVLWCQVEFSGETEEAARTATPADREDLENGCSTFAWTLLTPGQGPIALKGEWVDEWGGEHSIDNETWTQTYPEPPVIAFEVSSWDNAAEAAFAMNSEDNEFFGGDWSRFDWALFEDALWYCQTVFDGDDEEAVRAAAPADATDPSTGGCGGAAWTRMMPVEAE